MAKLNEITAEEFEELVGREERTVILFSQPTCMPCKVVEGQLAQLDIEVYKVNVFAMPKIAGRYKVMGTPQIFFFESGVPTKKFRGQGEAMQGLGELQEEA